MTYFIFFASWAKENYHLISTKELRSLCVKCIVTKPYRVLMSCVQNYSGVALEKMARYRICHCSSLMKHTSRAHYVAKMWRQANIPFQSIGLFSDNGWFPDGSIDRIDQAYPSNLECLLMENEASEATDDDDQDNVDDEEMMKKSMERLMMRITKCRL